MLIEKCDPSSGGRPGALTAGRSSMRKPVTISVLIGLRVAHQSHNQPVTFIITSQETRNSKYVTFRTETYQLQLNECLRAITAPGAPKMSQSRVLKGLTSKQSYMSGGDGVKLASVFGN